MADRSCTPDAYARILRVCAASGLAASDARDVAQEICVWLAASGRREVSEKAWIGVVARNFVHRYRRRQAIRASRESRAAFESAAMRRGRDGIEQVEIKLVLDKLGRNLPFVEARLLDLIREGCTFPEAVRKLGVPRGSWSYFKRRLVGHLKEGLSAPRRSSGARP
jgi:DNA-directed RNA polymerase specialized sigma24 family protein